MPETQRHKKYRKMDSLKFMFNPVEYFIRLFWPKGNSLDKELVIKYRVILYFNFMWLKESYLANYINAVPMCF
mgnify:CR=1 FL=1